MDMLHWPQRSYILITLIQLKKVLQFSSASGELKVYKKDDYLELDFPKDTFKQVDMIEMVESATGAKPLETYLGDINLLLSMRMKKLFQTLIQIIVLFQSLRVRVDNILFK